MTAIWVGKKVRLRGIEPDDWQAFQRFDDEMSGIPSADLVRLPRSATMYQEWAAGRAKQVDGGQFTLAVETDADGVHVGALSAHHVDQRAGRFSYGISIGCEYRHRGYATESIILLLSYMFNERRMNKCEVDIFDSNEASIALHQKIGFQVEGCLREHEYFGGRHHDVIVMGLTRREFEERHQSTGP